MHYICYAIMKLTNLGIVGIGGFPCGLVIGSGVFVGLLLFHNVTEILEGLAATSVVLHASFQQVRGHVVFATLDVDIAEEQPAFFQIFPVGHRPLSFRHSFQLITRPGRLF